ncbi:porin family protein [Psychroflexus halocasei]|uniref:Opacity protein n=1 Tax=Psychroflexus halocasei TaxID=908615 RepID=A0A1H3Z9Y7_9FLAO|nr:porin family protein [Psychroflexus halocasei]SEA20569.1 Opacity protein [Psychroflexus halocasei]
MKKLMLTVAITVGTILTSNAQSDSKVVQLGAKGGVNFASVTGDDFDSPDSRTSFNAGIVAEVPYSERFSLQAEVFYSGQGFEVEDINVAGVNFDTNKVEYQLDYIQVSLLAKVYLIEGLNVYAGPQIGFKVNEEIDCESGDVNVDDTMLPEAQDFDFSGTVGAGYKFDNGFFVDARYNYGFSDLIKDTDSHNSVIQAGVGFMF